jgi:hypothetical protein
LPEECREGGALTEEWRGELRDRRGREFTYVELRFNPNP